MSFLFFGDLHLNNWKKFSTILSNGINSRLADQMRVVGQISSHIKAADNIIFLGDLIDSYGETLPKVIYSAAFYTLKTWAKKCNHLYVLVGNHDRYRNSTIVHAFDEIDNVTVISDTCKVTIEGLIFDLVPWLAPLPQEKGDIFVGHVMPIGAHLGDLFTKRADEGVPIEWFKEYDYSICGHVHEPQDLPIPNSSKFVHCPGSIMQLNLSSSSAPRFMYHMDTNHNWSRIEIPSPKIHTIVFTHQEEIDNFFKKREYEPRSNTGDYYNLISTDISLKFPPFDYKITVEFIAKPTAGKQEIENIREMDLLEIINEFVDNSTTSIDKKLAKDYISKLY